MSRSGESCIVCVARRKKCDGTRSVCRRCVRDKVECGGYANARNPIRGVSTRRPRPTLPISPIDDIDIASSGLFTGNYYGPSWGSNTSSSEPATPAEWTNIEYFFSPPTPGSHPFLTSYPPRSTSPTPVPRQVPTPPYHPTDIGAFDEVPRTFLPPQIDVRQSMTTGQASLFDALLSLARPEDNVNLSRVSSSLHYASLAIGPMPAEPFDNSKYNVDRSIAHHDQIEPEDAHDAHIVGAKLCDALALDKKVKSNTLPFLLLSYALWMRQFLFEPVRIIPLAREYIIEEYSEGLAARGRMMAISNAVRAITGSTGYTLEAFEVLEPHMYQELARVPSTFGRDPATDRFEALLAMSTTYEVRTSLFHQHLAHHLPVHLGSGQSIPSQQSSQSHASRRSHLPLRYFAMLDVLLNAVIGRPMNFRYDTCFTPGVYASVFDLEQGPGPRWCYGVPDRLVIIFARMNALLEDFGSGVDMREVRELEAEIKEVKPIVVASADPILAVGRLVVQESWRQAAYIYLYMGLCGANSHDARVIKAHDDFMEVFVRTKPGRIPDSFMVLPLPILGIATRHPDDQELLKRRMLALSECARRGTTGNQFIRMLECIWGLVNDSGRPTSWSDLRLASLYVAGV
ncbi:fungal-specific transcription factor domain protein [Rhizoctonia solani 123E]|uniref:Fungal-specific transcription factor domain protein n=1 Tax=Rhizoctonia solani 123E TaxID=1423351 RepID=A0A074RT78_9AGAM|nr:fungal-specific transcription factor domain protein [Rhizoctonia solani 123E]